MTIAELKKIALHAAKGTVPTEFANQDIDVNAAFVDGLKELAGSVNQFMKNRYDIYEILVETVDQIMPRKSLMLLVCSLKFNRLAKVKRLFSRKRLVRLVLVSS